MYTKYDARETLAPMIADAKRRGLWFSCTSFLVGSLWFSPQELERELAAGRYHWGPENWRLEDPMKRVFELDREVVAKMNERDMFLKRVEAKP